MTKQPDRIACYDAKGKLTGWVPNYAKPGIAERVAQEVDEAEFAADPPRSSIGQLLRFAEVARRSKGRGKECR